MLEVLRQSLDENKQTAHEQYFYHFSTKKKLQPTFHFTETQISAQCVIII